MIWRGLGHMAAMILTGMSLSVVNPVSAQIDPNLPIIVSDLDWNADSSLIAIGLSAYGTGAICILDPNIQLWDVAAQEIIAIPRTGEICSVTNVDFSSGGSRLLVTSDSDVQIWNMKTGDRLQALLMETRFQHAYWNPDGTKFLDVIKPAIQITSGSDVSKNYGGLVAPKRLDNIFFTDSIWSPDGKRIASSSDDGTIYIWDVNNEDILQTFEAHTAAVQHLVWNASNNLIASGDDSGTILVWNPDTGETVAELKGHTDAVRDLDWRSDGQQLASTGADNTLRIWDWPSSQMQIVKDGESVWSLAYSPDGGQLAYGGEFTDASDVGIQIMDTPIETGVGSEK
jgi:WD40 repeat protein